MQSSNAEQKPTPRHKPDVIGLTGGMGSGKTVATDILKENGFFIVDADEISRKTFARGTLGEQKLMRLFPQAVANGALDRRALRNIIANDTNERERLNEFTHPIIFREIENAVNAADANPIILSAPLLFESGLDALCRFTIGIYCPENTRIERVCARDGVTAAEALAIIKTQLSDDELLNRADHIIRSDCEIAEFAARVLEFFIGFKK